MDRERFHFDRKSRLSPANKNMASRGNSVRNRSTPATIHFLSLSLWALRHWYRVFTVEYNLKKDVMKQAKELVGGDW
jgi:hypothetical protein